jgi:hypothetical protein
MRHSDIIAALVILTPLLVDCYGTPELRSNLSDNLIDKYLEPSAPYPYEQQSELIKRSLEKSFPIGSPTPEIVGYLRGIGASCDMQGAGKTNCRYEKYVEDFVRTYILLLGITIDREGYRETYILSIEIDSREDRLSGLTVDLGASQSRMR